MFKIALVVFRESLEIAILLGVILAITKRIEKSRLYIITGIMAGTTLVAFFSFFSQLLIIPNTKIHIFLYSLVVIKFFS